MITETIAKGMKFFIQILENKKYSHIFRVFFVFAPVVFVIFLAFSTYFLVKYGPFMLSLYEQKYIFKRIVTASADSNIPVSASIDQVLSVPVKKDIHFSYPLKTAINVPVNHTFYVPFDKPINIPIDHVFRVDENIRFKSEVPFETTVNIKIFGMNKEVPVKGTIPLDMVIPIKHDFHIQDTIAVKSKNPIPFPMKYTFDVPVDIMLKGDIPIDEVISVPIKSQINADVMLKKKFPVTVEFSAFFDQEPEVPAGTAKETEPGVSTKKAKQE